MNTQVKLTSMAIAFMISTLPLAQAQQSSGKSDMSNMPGMATPATKPQEHDMGGMDMGSMMKHCTAMRKQMKPGAAMSPDMQKMMSQCDAMDKSMAAPEQPYTPPADRRR